MEILKKGVERIHFNMSNSKEGDDFDETTNHKCNKTGQ